MGVFSYVLPFLLIFAVVFAILEKTKLFGENRAASAIIAFSIGLLSLQFDFVATFFATIFPRFGIGIAIMLVLLIALALWSNGDEGKLVHGKWIGYLVGIGVVVWAISAWGWWGSDWLVSDFLNENFWALIVLTLIIFGIYFVARGGKKPASHS
jgi:hypothetical protein